MKRIITVFVMFLVAFVAFAQEAPVVVTTTTVPAVSAQPAVPAQTSVPAATATPAVPAQPATPASAPVAKPVQVFSTDKITVEFFLDDGTTAGKKMDPKGFTLYLLRVIGDKPTAGQVAIIGEAGVKSFLTQKDGLYILGAHSNEYGWLGEGNFFINLSVKGYGYSSKGAKLFVDKNGNPQVFFRFEGFVPKGFKE